jgi:hypothetical protein
MPTFELTAILEGHGNCQRCGKAVRGVVACIAGHANGPPWCIACASEIVMTEAEDGPIEATKQQDFRDLLTKPRR